MRLGGFHVGFDFKVSWAAVLALNSIAFSGLVIAGCGGGGDRRDTTTPTTGGVIASRYRVSNIAPYAGYTVDQPPRFSSDGRVVLHTSENQWSVWKDGALTPLPLGFVAFGVNASGAVVGQDATRRAAIYRDGAMTQIPDLPLGSRAVDISDDDVVVGNANVGQGFSYRDGRLTLLANPDNNTFVTITQVTYDGKAFGYAVASDGSNSRAFVWNDDAPQVVADVVGLAINRKGQIAGYRSGNSGLIGIVRIDGSNRQVSTENSTTWSIGDQGVAVGTLYGDLFQAKSDRRPFAWYDGQLVSLRDRIVLNVGETTGVLEDGKAIRSDGAVLVIGRDGGLVQNRYYLLVPQR